VRIFLKVKPFLNQPRFFKMPENQSDFLPIIITQVKTVLVGFPNLDDIPPEDPSNIFGKFFKVD
jgi:hypothetical protein